MSFPEKKQGYRRHRSRGLGDNLQERRWQELPERRGWERPPNTSPVLPQALPRGSGCGIGLGCPVPAARRGFIIQKESLRHSLLLQSHKSSSGSKARAGRGKRRQSAERGKSAEKALAQKGARGGEAGSAFGERGGPEGGNPSERCGSPAPGHEGSRKSGMLPLPLGGCTAALPARPAPTEPARHPEPCPALTPSLPGRSCARRRWEEGWGERGELLRRAV